MLRPAEDRILIEPTEEHEMSSGGIVVTYVKREGKSTVPFRVVEVGWPKITYSGASRLPPYKAGDKVWVDLSMAYEATVAGKKMYIIENPYVWAYESC